VRSTVGVLVLGAALCLVVDLAGQAPRVEVTASQLTASPSDRRGSVRTSQRVDYDVVVTYHLNHSGAPIRLSALGIDGVGLQGILVRMDGSVMPQVEWSRSGPTDGSATLWWAELGPQTPGPDRVLEIAYTATAAFHGGARLTVPIVVPDADPPEPLPGAFEARIDLPGGSAGGMHVVRSFPSDVEGGTGPDDPTVVASLPVLPRLVRLDLRPGAGAPWSRISLLEATASLLILICGALGWRHLQGSAL